MKTPFSGSRMINWVIVGALLLHCAGSNAEAAVAGWIRSWSSAPTDAAFSSPVPSPIPLQDVSIRTIVRLSAGGKALRVRLSNELSPEPMLIGAISVALRRDGKTVPETLRTGTFGGLRQVEIPGGAVAVSDPMSLGAPALAEVIITIYIKGPAKTATAHIFANSTSEFLPGDQTTVLNPNPGFPTFVRYLVTGVDVLNEAPDAATIVILGDSITDGEGTGYGTYHRWTDTLAVRLAQAGLGGVAIANQGISGNQLRQDEYGIAALKRLDRDVFSVPNARLLIVFLGLNDIGIPPSEGRAGASLDDLIAAYKQVIAAAHRHDMPVIGVTVTPFKGAASGYYTEAGDATRRAVNEWIRTGNAFDAVFDFEQVARSRGIPSVLDPKLDSGDHIHLNDTGYGALAHSIELPVLRALIRKTVTGENR